MNASAPQLPPIGRIYCADITRIRPGYVCGDITLPTKEWPDKAIICVDDLSHCADLGGLRDWLIRYKARVSS